MSTTVWDPAQYDRFADERSRPFVDLVARIRTHDPRSVVDLGSGTGALTATLCDRWPHAAVLGIDNDEAMLAAARQRVGGQTNLRFDNGDLASWRPAQRVDVIVSNAALQWIPGHLALLPALVSSLAPGGALAFQVPGNFEDPHHQSIREVMARPQWRAPLAHVPERPLSSYPASVYLSTLAALGCDTDAWETTYVHVLESETARNTQGASPVLEWVKGTALRPILSALSTDQSTAFCAELDELLRARFGSYAWGTPFPFRRVFAVAHRPA